MFAPIYYYFALFLFVNSVDVCTSHEFSGVVYFQEIWEKKPLIDLFNKMIPDFDHKETGKYLDGRM